MTINSVMKDHWEKIYRDKRSDEVSWWQENPKTSLDFIHSLRLPTSARIIDVGGGDSKLVDALLDEGFENITVLDISENAIERAKQRLGGRAQDVHWIVSDVNAFHPQSPYDLWHDRATFHFLTTDPDIAQYITIARQAVRNSGYLIMGTFSTSGPKTCSGLTIRQYTEQTLASRLEEGFKKITCITEDHVTPFGTKQNFLFCSFQRL